MARVTSQQIEQYRRDGFVVVDGLLAPDEIERYGAAVDAAVARRTAWDTRSLDAKTPYEQSFQQCMNLWEDCPAVRPLTFHPCIGEVAAALVGTSCLRLWHDQALYKEPGGRATDAHNDQPYWPMVETDTITAWIPFDGSTIEGGAMGYVPGSHRFEGVRHFANIFAGQGFDLADPATGRGHPHFAVDRAGVRPGEVIRSDVTPLMWPRPGSVPPAPPPLPATLHPSLPGWRPEGARSRRPAR